MQFSNDKNPQSVSMWITSLAISVACCAVLFVIFANYLNDIKSQLAAESDQIAQMAQHQEILLAEIKNLHHAIAPAVVPAVAAPAVPVVPAVQEEVKPTVAPAVTVPSVAPTAPSVNTPVAPAPAGTTAPAVMTPPPASPTAVPEVPAKQ